MRGWRTGAPVDIAPLRDDSALGADPSRNDDFQYAVEPLSQERCPFAAHTRKTNPRADITSEQARDRRRILRRGITFGPEVSAEEAESNTSNRNLARGLLFVSYQSSIVNGFQFIQKSRSTLAFCLSNDDLTIPA
jgi:deferrochelatase/peroxidase EfeB